MSLTKKVAYNTSIQIIGKVITTIISLALVGILTRLLSVDGYGKIVTIFAFTGFFSVFADFGFFWISVRESAREPQNESKIVANIFTLRVIFALIVYSFGIITSLFIGKYSSLITGIIIGSVAMFFASLNATMVSVCQTHLRMDKASLTDIIGRAVTLLVVYLMVRSGINIVTVMFAYLAGSLTNFVMTYFFARKYVPIRFSFDWDYWKVILRESFPMAIVVVFSFIYFKIDVLILSLVKTSTDVGIYAPAYKVFEILLIFPAMFLGNIFPYFSKLANDENRDKLKVIFQKAFDFMALVAIPMIIGCVIFARSIINIIGGNQFLTESTINLFGRPATAVLVFQILSFAIGFSFINNVFGNLLISTRYQARLIIPIISLSLFNIGTNLFFIPRFSYVGAAFTTGLTEVLLFCINIYLLKKYVNILPNLEKIWRIALPALAMILIGSALRQSFIFGAIVSTVTFFLLAFWTKCYSKELIFSLIRKSESSN